MPNDEVERAKNLLIKMYLGLKIRKKEEIEDLKEKLLEENNKLKKFSIIELINYISNNINIFIEIKLNEKNEEVVRKEKEDKNDNNEEKELSKQYEELLIKAENDIRKHIKVRIIIFLTYFILFID